MTVSPDAALVLFSGGQDSTVCLAWALERFSRVETIGFDYGQRHAVELAVRPPILAGLRGLRTEWAARLGDSGDGAQTGEIAQQAQAADVKHQPSLRIR